MLSNYHTGGRTCCPEVRFCESSVEAADISEQNLENLFCACFIARSLTRTKNHSQVKADAGFHIKSNKENNRPSLAN